MLIPNESTGYKIISLAGWSGKCFVVPRVELRQFQNRPEANTPGIYFLFGESDESTNQRLYIGESETSLDRLMSHSKSKEKDFWNTAVVFTGDLDKAKVKYLESLSVKEALKAGRYNLENGNSPAENTLLEFDLVSTNDYFTKINYLLSALNYPVFQGVQTLLSDEKMYFFKGEGADAKAQLLTDGSLNVLKGSLARIRETESFWGWSQAARKRFLDEGILKDKGDGISYIYTEDVLFKSPSAAAATTIGRPVNGWTAWKDEQGNTLDENLRSRKT